MGVMISPALFFYGRTQPGVIGQAAVLTIGAFGIPFCHSTPLCEPPRFQRAWGCFLNVGLWVP